MRLFVAVELPEVIKDELARVVEKLRPLQPEAKWVPRANLHLTLSFLGEVAEENTSSIENALAPVAEAAKGISVRLGSLGAFPSVRRARVIWIALEDDLGGLKKIAAATAEALEPLGFPREVRPWSSHVTLARLRSPSPVTDVLSAVTIELPGFVTDGLTIYRSRLARPSPRYEPVARLPR